MNKDIFNKLANANEELKVIGKEIELVIVGGSAFIIKSMIPRETYDIDFINTVDQGVIAILESYEINDRVRTHESTFGEWEEDIIHLPEYSQSNIKVFTISNERLLAARLFSRRRTEDLIKTFENKEIKIDKDKFDNIIIELMGYNDPIYISEFIDNIDNIKVIYKERNWNEEKINEKLREWSII